MGVDAANATFDSNVLGQLRALQRPGEPDFVTSLIDLFVNQAQERLDLMERALSEQDAHELSLLAHSLKTSAAQVGAFGLHRLFASVEESAREVQIPVADSLLKRAQAEFQSVLTMLEPMRAPMVLQPA